MYSIRPLLLRSFMAEVNRAIPGNFNTKIFE